jgi:hypothetical protein
LSLSTHLSSVCACKYFYSPFRPEKILSKPLELGPCVELNQKEGEERSERRGRRGVGGEEREERCERSGRRGVRGEE